MAIQNTYTKAQLVRLFARTIPEDIHPATKDVYSNIIARMLKSPIHELSERMQKQTGYEIMRIAHDTYILITTKTMGL